MKLKKLLPAAAIMLCITVFVMLMIKSTDRLTLNTSAEAQEKKPNLIIDAGHGGEDGGAVVGDVLEKDINLDISNDTADLLKLFGFDVSMTRSSDNALTNEGKDVKLRKYNDMKMRLDMYNSSADNVIISIHQNKFSRASSHGAQVFYSPNNEYSPQLAESMRNSIVSMIQPDLKNTNNPAVIVECGFISNQNECKLLLDKSYQKKMALAVTTGFLDYYHGN